MAARRGVLVAGQGLAGSLLAWELERAGLDFTVADPGHAASATAKAAAGLANPVTGRRLVKTWRAETLLPAARAVYTEIGYALGAAVWRDTAIRRLWADDRERAAWAAKAARGELAPFAGPADAAGARIEGAGRVDLRRLLAGLRERWRRAGRLREEAVDPAAEAAGGVWEAVVDCRGLATARDPVWAGVPWTFSKGEVLELAAAGWRDEDEVRLRRHWAMPAGAGRVWVGATHEPGVTEGAPGAAARATLTAAARELIGTDFEVTGQRAGVRVTLPDKRPVAGWHPARARLGVLGGLGAKGVLLAPWLAREWVAALRRGGAWPEEVAVARFGGKESR